MKKVSLFLVLGAVVALLGYDFWIKQNPILVTLVPSASVDRPRPPREAPRRPAWESEESDASLPPEMEVTLTDELAMVSPETLQTITRMLEQVEEDLESGIYGRPQQLSYNIVYLFRQSLAAYLRFLSDPETGPDFHILFHRPFSGRYQFHKDVIVMGQPTLENGEGRFITTMFHEYQHHLFHTIYGTPEFTDIVWKFYNELAAHMFEELFAAYLPPEYFEKAHRGGLPRLVKRQLANDSAYDAIGLIYDMMVPPQGNRPPFYRFMMPARDGFLEKREMVHSIDSTFHPDPSLATEFSEIATDYWHQTARN